MNLTPEQWAYIVKVALPSCKTTIALDKVIISAVYGTKEDDLQFFLRNHSKHDITRLALSRATYDEKTQIMAMVLGGKE